MINVKNNFFILTGAPGTGKSSLIQVLEKNFQCVHEPAREIISEQRAIQGEGTSDQNEKLFVELLLSRSIAKYNEQKEGQRPVFFDRGIPDVIGYAASYKLPLEKFERASEIYRYNKTVFVLFPWESIYCTDEERRMTFEQTIVFHKSLMAAYEKCGYQILELPFASIEERADFIYGKIKGK